MNLIKEKRPLNSLYVLKYPSLENKNFGVNLIKIGYEIGKIF